MKRKIIAAVLAVVMTFTLTACGGDSATSVKSFLSDEQSQGLQNNNVDIVEVEYKDNDRYFEYGSDAVLITLSGDKAIVSGEGVTLGSNVITITQAGTYVLSGEYDGTVVVEAGEKDDVFLVLENVEIKAEDGPAIYEKTADKVVLMLPEGTENKLEDSAEYSQNEEKNPTAAVFCRDSLTINGTGKLDITANYKDGITSKGKLKIMSGSVSVTSADDGIVAKNLIAVKDGTISVISEGDALKATKEEDEEKGSILIEGGTLTLTSGKDGIQAEKNIAIKGGTISVTAGNGAGEFSASEEDFSFGKPFGEKNDSNTSNNASESVGKGLKAGNALAIGGGKITLNTGNDAVHSDGSILLTDADMQVASGDDAFHAETTLVVNGGTYNVSQCYEGFEAGVITVNAGNINILSEDDGFNATDGNDNTFGKSESTAYIYINGGEITINSYGDGIDSNGSIEMNGGYVVVSSSTTSANNATDFQDKFYMNGGTIIACGSSGMYQSISEESKCFCINYFSSGTIAAKTNITLSGEDGELLSFELLKQADAILIAGDKLTENGSYTLTVDGTENSVTAESGSESSNGFEGKDFGGANPFGKGNGFDKDFKERPDVSGGEFPGDGTMTPPEGFEAPPEGFEGFDGQNPFGGELPGNGNTVEKNGNI